MAASLTLVERLRSVHLEMLDAVLGGEGLGRVAELAAHAAGGAVAIVLPRHDVAVASPEGGPGARALPALRRVVADRASGRRALPPAGVVAEAPITAGDDLLGVVALVAPPGAAPPPPDAAEFLHIAAVAAMTDAAVEQAREEVERTVRGSFLEDLRSRRELDGGEVARRAARLGCDLSGGAIVLCAELSAERPRHVVATIADEFPGALAEHVDGRVYAVLPASRPEETLAAARRLATRLQRHGTVALSSFCAAAAGLPRAVEEAELVLDVLRRSGEPAAIASERIGTGTYRLLFRVLASHPEEVRSFFEDTVAPIVRYDDQYRTDLVGTLEAYLEQNCNMNATAAAIYAHRHTVAYRLDRIRDLTGLDPAQSEDRERLGLGLKAYRIIAPRLPR